MALSEKERRREEDPYTDAFAKVAPTWMVVNSSRFEMDLNRPNRDTVYDGPERAWGLEVWKHHRPNRQIVQHGQAQHRAFYRSLEVLLDNVCLYHRYFVVLDMHSYCHRRGGPKAPPAPTVYNPEINIGTSNLDPAWLDLVDQFASDIEAYDPKNKIDVAVDVKFTGGYLSRWINRRYRGRGCAIAVEVKKTFMDEWSGRLFTARHRRYVDAIASCLPNLQGLLEE